MLNWKKFQEVLKEQGVVRQEVITLPIGINCVTGVVEDIVFNSNTGGTHLICNGLTGAGKSNLLRLIITSYCERYGKEVGMLSLWDMKGVESGLFVDLDEKLEFLPQLVLVRDAPDTKRVMKDLDCYVRIIRRKLETIRKVNVKNIEEYNEFIKNVGEDDTLEHDFAIIDEYQVIYENCAIEEREIIDRRLLEIAKLGRTAGFHLIFLSQSISRSISRDIIDNFDMAIALRSTAETSIALIGTTLASKIEEPCGYGYLRADYKYGYDRPVRINIPYISEEEIKKITVCSQGCKNEDK